jgi:hypothetical protein
MGVRSELEKSVGVVEKTYQRVHTLKCLLMVDGSFSCLINAPEEGMDTASADRVIAKGAVTSELSNAGAVGMLSRFTSPSVCRLYDVFGERVLVCTPDFDDVQVVRKRSRRGRAMA